MVTGTEVFQRHEGRQTMKRPGVRNSGRGGRRGNRGLGRHRRSSNWATQRPEIRPIEPFSRLSSPDVRKVAGQTDSVAPREAIVDAEKCIGCGTCQEVCPLEAISVNRVARIDQNRCSGCGLCVTVCPEGSLSMSSTRAPATKDGSGSSLQG